MFAKNWHEAVMRRDRPIGVLANEYGEPIEYIFDDAEEP